MRATTDLEHSQLKLWLLATVHFFESARNCLSITNFNSNWVIVNSVKGMINVVGKDYTGI